jgi:MoxR-like ATPase
MQVDVGQRIENELRCVTSPEEILAITSANSQVRVEPPLLQYINRIVRQTRKWPPFYLGASPRAGIALMQGARTLAAFRGRDYAIPDDVAELVLPALRHRVSLTAEAEVEGLKVDEQLLQLLKTIEVPRK